MAEASPEDQQLSDVNLPDDAKCWRCGYALQGLRENRCPECGLAFEPEEYHNSYLPKWPILLGWMLFLYLANSTFVAIHMSLSIEGLNYQPVPEWRTFWAQWVCSILLCVLAVVSIRCLWRRRYTFRRYLYTMYALHCVWILLCIGTLVESRMSYGNSLRSNVTIESALRGVWDKHQSFLVAAFPEYVLPHLLIILFLCTGFRRQLLYDITNQRPTRVNSSNGLRGDWLLLWIITLFGFALQETHELIEHFPYLGDEGIMSNIRYSLRDWGMVLQLVRIKPVLIVIWCGVTAWMLWHDPRRLRGVTWVTLVLMTLAQTLFPFEFYMDWGKPITNDLLLDPDFLVIWGWRLGSVIMGWGVMLWFAYRHVSRAELEALYLERCGRAVTHKTS